MSRVYKIFLSAAEPSADIHCAHLITALKASGYEFEIAGLGGEEMRRAGCELLENMAERAAMHYNVLGQLGYYHKLKKRVSHYFASTKVDLAVVCDSPSWNFHVAQMAKDKGVKTLFYVAPQLWAWGGWRINKMRRLCDRLACILPFEQQWFTERGVNSTFVGNPLFDNVPEGLDEIRKNRVFDSENKVFALMPGSRRAEIQALWGPMQEVAGKLAQVFTGARFITVAANEKILGNLRERQVPDFVCEYDVSSVITTACKADFTLVASGSATLQVAAAGCPMAIMYQSNKFLWHLVGKRLLKTQYLSLPNILANKELVLEFMPYFDSTEPIFEMSRELISDVDIMAEMSAKLIALTEPFMGNNASNRVSQIILDMLAGG